MDANEKYLRVPIERYLRYLAVERNFSPYTVKSYSEDLEAWLEYEKACHDGVCPRPDRIGVPELRGYVLAMSEAEYSKATIARRLASLRGFYKFGEREGWAIDNPARVLRNPRARRPLPFVLSTTDVEKLLDCPDVETPLGIRDRAILEILYSGGLRVSECVGLLFSDLLLDEELLKIREESGTGILLVTHHLGIAKKMADNIGIMKEGRLIEYGSTDRIFDSPENEYTAKLIRDVPKLKK